MGLSTFWARVNPFARLRQAKALQGVHSARQFRAILERERARADRNGHQFSMIIFETGNPNQDSPQVQRLAQTLVKRIRSSDEAGWFDGHRIAVVLPETSADGAWRLADDVCQAITAKSSPPKCAIYTYPSKRYPQSQDHSHQLHFSDLSSKWKSTASPYYSASTKHTGRRNIDFTSQQPKVNKTQNGGELAEGLKPFLLRPLPVWKRSMDVVGALIGLIVSSPFLLLITLIIKIVSPGPVFFKQQRVGYMGKIFAMWKFRTMRVNADTSVHQQHLTKLINSVTHNDELTAKPMTKLDDNPQIIPFGKILRKTCLDELPQLINVLRGEMSLVGPRPPIPYEVDNYLQWHCGRFNAVPGMTGLWQVSGKNKLSFPEMIRLDIQYLRKKSLWLDTKIILKTPLAIFSDINGSFALKDR
jgi:lipopolysaccharide/colanic/teichoic acid biosynthesis glycosyltransferase/GGDEF domain-containing protein